MMGIVDGVLSHHVERINTAENVGEDRYGVRSRGVS